MPHIILLLFLTGYDPSSSPLDLPLTLENNQSINYTGVCKYLGGIVPHDAGQDKELN